MTSDIEAYVAIILLISIFSLVLTIATFALVIESENRFETIKNEITKLNKKVASINKKR